MGFVVRFVDLVVTDKNKGKTPSSVHVAVRTAHSLPHRKDFANIGEMCSKGKPKMFALDLYSNPQASHLSFEGNGAPRLGQAMACSEIWCWHSLQGFSMCLQMAGPNHARRQLRTQSVPWACMGHRPRMAQVTEIVPEPAAVSGRSGVAESTRLCYQRGRTWPQFFSRPL
jgi:hypothetical protein